MQTRVSVRVRVLCAIKTSYRTVYVWLLQAILNFYSVNEYTNSRQMKKKTEISPQRWTYNIDNRDIV